MVVKNDVFGSDQERENYYSLQRKWGNDWTLYHNLPFLFVFDLDALCSSLSGKEKSRLKKTSIDYTLCDSDDRPLLSVDLDGIGQGFNIGREYRVPPDASAPNPWREQIFSLKLRVAHSLDYPFFVLGSNYFESLTDELRLSLVDGIIGSVLENRAKDRRISEYLADVEIDHDPMGYRRDLVQDQMIGIEVAAEIEFNPLVEECWKRVTELDIGGWKTKSLFEPPLPEFEDAFARAKAMEEAQFIGAKVTLDADDELASAAVWIPNFDVPGFDAFGSNLTTHAAFILACEKLERKRHAKRRSSD